MVYVIKDEKEMLLMLKNGVIEMRNFDVKIWLKYIGYVFLRNREKGV